VLASGSTGILDARKVATHDAWSIFFFEGTHGPYRACNSGDGTNPIMLGANHTVMPLGGGAGVLSIRRASQLDPHSKGIGVLIGGLSKCGVRGNVAT